MEPCRTCFRPLHGQYVCPQCGEPSQFWDGEKRAERAGQEAPRPDSLVADATQSRLPATAVAPARGRGAVVAGNDGPRQATADFGAVSDTAELPPLAGDAGRLKRRTPTMGTAPSRRLVLSVVGTVFAFAIAGTLAGTLAAMKGPSETPLVAPPLPTPKPTPTTPDAVRFGPDKDTNDDKDTKNDQDADGPDTSADSGGTSGGGGTSAAPAERTQEQATDFLWADGNVDPDNHPYWSQSSVTVKTTTPLTKLKVVVRLVQTGGVYPTGAWSSLGDKTTVTSAVDSEQVIYVATLRQGFTIDPGTHVFTFQYQHEPYGRDAGRDVYNVTATSADSTTERQTGDFH